MNEKKTLSRKSTQPIVSLLGKELFYSILDDEDSIKSREKLDAMIKESLSNMEKDPKDPIHYICAGFYTWLLRDISGSLAIYDKGTTNCPDSYELYWYKTLHKTTTRDLVGAISDAECAVELIKGKPDHGLDIRVFLNPHGYYPYTINFMIWYHLGMAYYLNGDLEKAKQAYLECDNFIYGNDALAARSCWFYPVLRELGEYDQATALMTGIKDDIKIIADPGYGETSLLFKGTLSVADVQEKADSEGNLNIFRGWGL